MHIYYLTSQTTYNPRYIMRLYSSVFWIAFIGFIGLVIISTGLTSIYWIGLFIFIGILFGRWLESFVTEREQGRLNSAHSSKMGKVKGHIKDVDKKFKDLKGEVGMKK